MDLIWGHLFSCSQILGFHLFTVTFPKTDEARIANPILELVVKNWFYKQNRTEEKYQAYIRIQSLSVLRTTLGRVLSLIFVVLFNYLGFQSIHLLSGSCLILSGYKRMEEQQMADRCIQNEQNRPRIPIS